MKIKGYFPQSPVAIVFENLAIATEVTLFLCSI